MKHIVHDGAFAPADAVFVHEVEEVDDGQLHHDAGGRPLEARLGPLEERRTRSVDHQLGNPVGFDPKARVLQLLLQRVDAQPLAERQEQRPHQQHGQRDVAAVGQIVNAAVEADMREQRQALHQLRSPAQQQARVHEADQHEEDRRFVQLRDREEDREAFARLGRPQHRVVRHQPCVRVPDVHVGHAPQQVPQQQDAEGHAADAQDRRRRSAELLTPGRALELLHERSGTTHGAAGSTRRGNGDTGGLKRPRGADERAG